MGKRVEIIIRFPDDNRECAVYWTGGIPYDEFMAQFATRMKPYFADYILPTEDR
jgi:hypothetical protein